MERDFRCANEQLQKRCINVSVTGFIPYNEENTAITNMKLFNPRLVNGLHRKM
jgi:hypothetical protein